MNRTNQRAATERLTAGALRWLGRAIGLWAISLASFGALTSAFGAVPTQNRPNIVLILADDLGYADLGCYGSEIQTPNLDKLAAGGLRFSQFYNCALCGPSRAALMTGLHPHQVGISGWTGLLNDRCVTIFELLKRGGYTTGAVGRLDMTTAESWHEPANIQHHVDRFLGSTGHKGPGNYFKAVHNTSFFRNAEPYTLPDPSYKTDLITDFAVEFIAEAAKKPAPFLLYCAQFAPHWPLHAKEADMAKYRRMYREQGWDNIRAARFARQQELGLVSKDTRMAPRDSRVPAWDKATHQEWEAERMAAFAGQVDALDQSVGRIVSALEAAGVRDNTLILFLSDNGASDQSLNAKLDTPGQAWRVDGTRTQVGNKPTIQPGVADGFVTGGPECAHVSNTPYRKHKSTNHEGGIATPCIANWPGVIKQHGQITPELGHITDIMATCLDVSGIEYPSEFAGRSVQPLAGKSLLPVLKGGERQGHASLCWSTSGNRAVRMGSWKLVSGKDRPWELYDLATDRTELRDLATEQPERVAALEKEFEVWLKNAPKK